MVIDTSALIAVLMGETEAVEMSQLIAADHKILISAFTFLETSIVIEAKVGELGSRELDLLLYKIKAEIISMDAEQAEIAKEAWQKYGKGRHSAGLNIGDCCSYALAKISGEPLLFKGEDFNQTDIQIVAKSANN